MAYRSEHFERVAQGRSVLQMAMDLHEWASGAADMQDSREVAQALQQVLKYWRKSMPRYERFDNAVKQVIEIALAEAVEKITGIGR